MKKNPCQNTNTELRVENKLLTAKYGAVYKQNKEQQVTIKHLEYQLFKYEIMGYGSLIIVIIILFLICKKAINYTYKKEYKLELFDTTYETRSETRVVKEDQGSKLEESCRVHVQESKNGCNRSFSTSDTKCMRRKNRIRNL